MKTILFSILAATWLATTGMIIVQPATSTGPTLVNSFTPSGTLHIATHDGEAMFFDDSEDYSSYAGTDAGSTPYYIEFEDSSGYVATAYGGAGGGGVALGSELITDGDCSTDSFLKGSGWTYDGSNLDYDKAAGGSTSLYQLISLTGGALYQTVFTVVASSGGRFYSKLDDQFGADRSSTGTFTDHITAAASGGRYSGVRSNSTVTGTVDDISIKVLTDVATTGLHLMSTEGGTTRNMAGIDTGFDPNDITAVRVYSLP